MRNHLEKIITDFYQSQNKKIFYPGLCVSVLMKGSNKENFIIGSANIQKTENLNESHLFQIGSVTKVFTAAIVLTIEKKLNKKGYVFNIDQTIYNYLPQKFRERWGTLTIRQLLNHTSGIIDYFNLKNFKNLIYNKSKHWSDIEILELALNEDLLFIPGKGFAYSSTNYFLIKIIIDELLKQHHQILGCDKTFDAFLQSFINKLGLTNTHYVSSIEDYQKIEPQLARGYSQAEFGFKQDEDVTSHDLTYAGAAGAIISNASDVAKFMQKLFIENSILSSTQLAKMKEMVCMKSIKSYCFFTKCPAGTAINIDKSHPLGYGLGLCQRLTPQGMMYFHSGSTLGHQCEWAYFPQDNLIVAITSNHDFGSSTLGNLIFSIKNTCTRELALQHEQVTQEGMRKQG